LIAAEDSVALKTN